MCRWCSFPVGPADQLLTFPVPVHQPFHAFLWITVHEELGCADRARPCLTHDLSMSDCEVMNRRGGGVSDGLIHEIGGACGSEPEQIDHGHDEGDGPSPRSVGGGSLLALRSREPNEREREDDASDAVEREGRRDRCADPSRMLRKELLPGIPNEEIGVCVRERRRGKDPILLRRTGRTHRQTGFGTSSVEMLNGRPVAPRTPAPPPDVLAILARAFLNLRRSVEREVGVPTMTKKPAIPVPTSAHLPRSSRAVTSFATLLGGLPASMTPTSWMERTWIRSGSSSMSNKRTNESASAPLIRSDHAPLHDRSANPRTTGRSVGVPSSNP